MKRIDVVIGSIFLLFGILLLTWTTKGIPLHLLDKLRIYWPVIIIIFGIYFLLCAFLEQRISALITVSLVGFFGIFLYTYNPILVAIPPVEEFKEYISEKYEDISGLEVDLDLDVGKADISGESKDLYDGIIVHSNTVKVNRRFFKWDSKAKLIIETTWNKSVKRVKKDNIWNLHFNNTVPLELNLRANVSSVSVDLTSLRASTVKIDANVSAVDLIVGKRNSDVEVNCDVSSINIAVPKGVSAVVNVDKALSGVEIVGFKKMGGEYLTSDSTNNPVRIRIRGNLSKISLIHR